MCSFSKKVAHSRYLQRFAIVGICSIATLLGACGGDSPAIKDRLDSDLINGATPTDSGQSTDSEILTGVFIDALVSNLPYVAGDIQGTTNQFGEFNYREGDIISFSIGATQLPVVLAKPVVTPLDLFSTDSVEHEGVANLSRLLQTLDLDANAENGIQIREDTDAKLQDTEIDLSDGPAFDATISETLTSNGLDIQSVTSRGAALTHLSNSLIENDLIEASSISSEAVVATDAVTGREVLVDADGDSMADVFDEDDDNDGWPDDYDAFPLDANEFADNDGDGEGDNADSDDDNDGVSDEHDALPFDGTEISDVDSDGIGDNADTDNDNDGVGDEDDVFPLDSGESSDNDQDGVGDNADVDDDNDGVLDENDAFPLDATESSDRDADGIGDNVDIDNDNDGVRDTIDAFPSDAYEYVDFDGDGIGDNADRDDDGDGTSDGRDTWSAAFTIDMTAPLDTSSCSRYSYGAHFGGAFSTYYCYTSPADTRQQPPSELLFQDSAWAVHGNLVEKEIDIAINMYSYAYPDPREINILVEGVLLSMHKGDPASVRFEVPPGAQLHAVYTDLNWTTSTVKLDAEGDLFSPSTGVGFALKINHIENLLSKHGRQWFLTDSSTSWMIKTVFAGVQFHKFYQGLTLDADEYTITVGDRTITGHGQRGALVLEP